MWNAAQEDVRRLMDENRQLSSELVCCQEKYTAREHERACAKVVAGSCGVTPQVAESARLLKMPPRGRGDEMYECYVEHRLPGQRPMNAHL